jgi:hypothetical protein
MFNMSHSWYDTLSAMNGEGPELKVTEPTSAEIEAQIAELQDALVKAKEREAKAKASKAGVYVYAWDMYLDPADKGTWVSATDNMVYATERDAYKAGCRELDICYTEGLLYPDAVPDDYIVDTVKLPVSQVPAEVLKDCGLSNLLK